MRETNDEPAGRPVPRREMLDCKTRPQLFWVEGGKAVRVMLPLYYGKGCLGCHGTPKGETDVSGYKKEGANEGDLGGAISVKLPVK